MSLRRRCNIELLLAANLLKAAFRSAKNAIRARFPSNLLLSAMASFHNVLRTKLLSHRFSLIPKLYLSINSPMHPSRSTRTMLHSQSDVRPPSVAINQFFFSRSNRYLKAKFLYRAETGLSRSPHLAIELGKSKTSGTMEGSMTVLHISTSSVASD